MWPQSNSQMSNHLFKVSFFKPQLNLYQLQLLIQSKYISLCKLKRGSVYRIESCLTKETTYFKLRFLFCPFDYFHFSQAYVPSVIQPIHSHKGKKSVHVTNYVLLYHTFQTHLTKETSLHIWHVNIWLNTRIA